jgi:hypothetical protein
MVMTTQKTDLKLRNQWPGKWLIFALLALLISPLASAENSDAIDVVLILDTSGSMAHHDRHRLRVEAAKMFVALMNREDRVAVMRFSGRAQQVTALGNLLDDKHRERVLNAVNRVTAKGAHTNIYDALQKAHKLLRRHQQPKRMQHIILMTDGKMDVGDKQRDTRLIEKMLGDLGPQLAKDRIKVHAIAFTESSNIPLLRLATRDTKGYFTLLKNASGIHSIFEAIFERTKNPDMLPITEDSFIVDEHVKEMTIVISKFKSDARVALETPRGETIFENTHHPSVRWFGSRQFDLITIRNPESGYWLIKFSEGGNKAYIVTDLKIRMETATEVFVNDQFDLHVWLERDGKIIKSGPLLRTTKFLLEIKNPDGKKRLVPIKPLTNEDGERHPGIFRATLAFASPGNYRVRIASRNETFDRQKTRNILVKEHENMQPFAILDENVDSATTTDMADASQGEDKLAHAAADTMAAKTPDADHADAAEQPAMQPEATMLASSETMQDHAESMAGENGASAGEHAGDQSPPAGSEHPDEPAKENKDDSNAGKIALIVFLLFNVITGVGVLGYFIYRKFIGPRAGRSAGGIDLGTGAGPISAADAVDPETEFSDINVEEIDEEGALEEDKEA